MSATNTHLLREISDTTSRVSAPPTIEAYLRLVDVRPVNWQDRAYFLAICARVMRRIPLAYARSCGIVKPGAGQVSLEIEAGLAAELSTDANFLEVNDARKRQAEIGPGKSMLSNCAFLKVRAWKRLQKCQRFLLKS